MASTTWQNRIWQEFHAGNLTRAYKDVLLTLHTFRSTGGVAWPSHDTLADRADCCVRTVQRALRAAADLDLVTWAERRVRAGFRWLRTSNLYRFLTPDRPSASTGQHGRQGERIRKKGAFEGGIGTAPVPLPPGLSAMAARLVAESEVRVRKAWGESGTRIGR